MDGERERERETLETRAKKIRLPVDKREQRALRPLPWSLARKKLLGSLAVSFASNQRRGKEIEPPEKSTTHRVCLLPLL